VKNVEFTLPLIIPIPIALFGAWLSILLDGVERKIKARIQSRIGPPVTQTLYDLLKLLEKEVKPIHTMPFVCLPCSFISSNTNCIDVPSTHVYFEQ